MASTSSACCGVASAKLRPSLIAGAPEPVASFLGWLQEDVEAADLEDWRADAARLYPMGEDDFLPGMNVDVSEPGASISPAGMDDDDDDDDDEWFDDDLD